MTETLEKLIGETLVFGIPGPRATRDDLRLFRETHAVGLILYRINFRSPEQIRTLIRDMEQALGRRLLVTVDHEGGRVVMFQSGVTVFPDNLAFGHYGKTSAVREEGTIEGRELRRLGMDVSFSPTVDVLTKAFSPNIGIRSYGSNPDTVARLASARIRALQREGVSACAKHFPGLGPATRDPHVDLPVVSVGWSELRKNHLVPFRAAIQAGVDMVMSSHPLYPKLDPQPKTPATFSLRLMTDLLRKELGFRGVVASDDLEMGALRGLARVGRAAVLATRAGHDLILCCHKNNLQREVFHDLREAYRAGELRIKDLEQSVNRIRALRGRKQPRFSPGAPCSEPLGSILANTVARGALHVRTGRVALPIKTTGPLQILFPRLSELSKTIMIEPELCQERTFLKRFIPSHTPAQIRLLSLNPNVQEICRVTRKSHSCSATVFFCYDAHLQPGNHKLLKALEKLKQPLVLVLMRDPYDGEETNPTTTLVNGFGFRQVQLEACLEWMFR
jgi:beta-N-acetylhexosaminidase